jgi:hypothetical protein
MWARIAGMEYPVVPCTKQAFTTPEQAQRQLRLWQRKGRRAELDNAHVYRADCEAHRGKFHIGRKHDSIKRGRPGGNTYAAKRTRIMGELDDLFDRQFLRISHRFARDDERRRRRFVRDDEGPFVQSDNKTLAPAGDEIHVTERK